MNEIPKPLSADQVLRFHETLSNWGRFGTRDQLGTLNLITEEKRRAAAGCIRTGRTVSCSRTLPTEPGPHNPRPVTHHMIATATEGWGGDYFGIAPHGFATSHIDALCHVFHEGKLYNGYPIENVTAHGALELGMHEVEAGIVTRGVLLDVARVRGMKWLDPGTPIFVEDLERAEEQAELRTEPGDVVFLHTGRWRRHDDVGSWEAGELLAGLDASCLPWLHERGVAALGCDGVSDVIPSRVDGAPMPIHNVAIVAMGLHLIDNLELGRLATACTEENRWEFFLTIAPLLLFRGTGSPVNPIAVF